MQQGWNYRPEISYYELLLLYNALKRHESTYSYCPIAVAIREQTGTKYHFLCIAKPLTSPGTTSHFADIEVYKPVKGMPYISRLKRINFNELLW